MHIKISKSDSVIKIVALFRNLYNIVENVKITLSDKSLYIQGMNNTHVCLVEVIINDTWFDYFNCEEEEIVVNTEMLFKVMNCWSEEYCIELKTDDDNLKINLTGEGKITKAYELPLLVLDTNNIKIPDMEYDVDIALKTHEFKELVNELTIFDKDIRIKCNETSINLSACGEYGKVSIDIKDGDILEYSVAIEEGGEINMQINGDYLSNCCNLNKLNDTVELHITKDSPIKICYNLDDDESGDSDDKIKNYIVFYIAPGIDE